jgi:hypothetical protein
VRPLASNVITHVAFLVVVCSISVLGTGTFCDREVLVTYRNTTSQTVVVFEGGVRSFEIPPQSQKRIATLESSWRHAEIRVVGQDGRTLFDRTLSLDDLKRMGKEILIRE